MKKNYKELLNHIKAFVFDIDGVFTDGTFQISADGKQVRTLNGKDSYAVQLAVKKGYKVAIITGGKAEGVKESLQRAGVTDIYISAGYKMDAWEDFLSIYADDFKSEEIMYMGDDIPDFMVMQKAGVACAPSNAAPEIKQISHYVSPYSGGQGCVRDIIEQTLKVQSNWMLEGDFTW
jgi:3-deoxy-D-manno-octulosonate 8-phosphate phosphatase (KDO 8-P phosphatase)